MSWMKSRGLNFKTVDVLNDPEAYRRMREVSGQSLTPTLEMPDGSVLADFDVKQLERFLKERNTL